MKITDPIAIVCVCDNHYSILLAALIKSIESNHHTAEKLDFFIVEDGITTKNKNRITNSLSSDKTVIHWLPMAQCLPDNAKLPIDKSSLPLNVYVRLFIPFFIPETTKRVIYLDVDMIMLEDVSKLWNADLSNHIVAAVQDQFIQIVSRWGGITNYQQFGIPADNKYFNSGLMVIDIEKWKQADITDKVLKCIIDNKKDVLSFYDQYGLNAVLAFEWMPLDPLWNRFAYSEEKSPFLIHFTGRKPIYKSYEFSEDYRKVFYHYLSMTGWKNFKPIGETSRYIKKLNNFLGKIKTILSLK